jgi:neopullulanase
MAEISTPDWVKHAVFYQIFPDRFAKSDRVSKPSNLESWDSPPTVFGFKGGDLLGVAEHLDYLEELGIDAIYFNPVFQSTANHRYHTYDYYQVDPILGGNQAFREMLDAAHTRGIRVVLDGVFNHASRGFYQFQHTLENGIDSPYLDWFNFDLERLRAGKQLQAYPGETRESSFRQRQEAIVECGHGAWRDMPALPEFDTDTEAVRAFLFDVARHWIELGVDGWRLDVPHEIDDDAFWREFRRLVKQVNAEAYIVGEIWFNAHRWLQGDQFDAVMNYIFNRACLGFFGGDSLDTTQRPGGYELRRMTATEFADRIDELLELYDWEITVAQFNLLSSHDMPRFLTLVRGDKEALKLATLFQMVYPGAPSIYYGDEIGMEGGADPDSRRAFPWDESAWDHELLAYFRRATALRREHPALRTGRYVRLLADDRYNVYAFAREGERQTLVVVFNNGPGSYELDIDAKGLFTEDQALQDVWGDQEARISEGRILGATLPPGSAAVLTT